MSDTEKIIILHDTNMFEVDPNFSRWVLDFRANVIEAQNRIPGSAKQFFLSQDFTISPDQPVQIRSDDFDSFIILLTDDINRTRNLKNQFEQVFDMSGDATKNPTGKKRKMELIFSLCLVRSSYMWDRDRLISKTSAIS